jgi:hypothetical protein
VCAAVVAANFSTLHASQPQLMDLLPRDLVQRICDCLLASGRFTLDTLQRFNTLDLDAISLEPYAHLATNEWVICLARCERLRCLDLSRCTRVCEWRVLYVGASTPPAFGHFRMGSLLRNGDEPLAVVLLAYLCLCYQHTSSHHSFVPSFYCIGG